MKLILSLLSTCLLFSACTENKTPVNVPSPVVDLFAVEAPENPAPADYIESLQYSVNTSSALLPSPVAFLDSVVEGSPWSYSFDPINVVPVDAESRQLARDQLTPEGFALLLNVEKNCNLGHAVGTFNNETAPGSTFVKTGEMSVTGDNCPLKLKNSFDIREENSTGPTVDNQEGLSVQGVTSYFGEIELSDERMIRLSGIKSIKHTVNQKTNDVVFASSATFKTIADGYQRVEFASGEVVEGPLYFDIETNMERTEDSFKRGYFRSRYAFHGRSSKGLIRIVTLNDGVHAPASYVNGRVATLPPTSPFVSKPVTIK